MGLYNWNWKLVSFSGIQDLLSKNHFLVLENRTIFYRLNHISFQLSIQSFTEKGLLCGNVYSDLGIGYSTNTFEESQMVTWCTSLFSFFLHEKQGRKKQRTLQRVIFFIYQLIPLTPENSGIVDMGS